MQLKRCHMRAGSKHAAAVPTLPGLSRTAAKSCIGGEDALYIVCIFRRNGGCQRTPHSNQKNMDATKLETHLLRDVNRLCMHLTCVLIPPSGVIRDYFPYTGIYPASTCVLNEGVSSFEEKQLF